MSDLFAGSSYGLFRCSEAPNAVLSDWVLPVALLKLVDKLWRQEGKSHDLDYAWAQRVSTAHGR